MENLCIISIIHSYSGHRVIQNKSWCCLYFTLSATAKIVAAITDISIGMTITVYQISVHPVMSWNSPLPPWTIDSWLTFMMSRGLGGCLLDGVHSLCACIKLNWRMLHFLMIVQLLLIVDFSATAERGYISFLPHSTCVINLWSIDWSHSHRTYNLDSCMRVDADSNI